MKRILLAALILFTVGAIVYAQQQGSNYPSSAETRRDAQQYVSQARANADQYESNLADLRERNSDNSYAFNFFRLRDEIKHLESMITAERNNIEARLDTGTRVSTAVFNRYQRMVDQHKARTTELEELIAANEG